MSAQITELTSVHHTALAAFVGAFHRIDEPIHGYFFSHDADPLSCIDTMQAWSKGQQLRSGWVPQTTRFYIENGELLGVYAFRHSLNDWLRQFGGHVGYSVHPDARNRGVATALLSDAKRLGHSMGIEHLVVTCNVNNVASKRVIEKNGGLLDDTYFFEPEKVTVHRFTIATAPN